MRQGRHTSRDSKLSVGSIKLGILSLAALYSNSGAVSGGVFWHSGASECIMKNIKSKFQNVKKSQKLSIYTSGHSMFANLLTHAPLKHYKRHYRDEATTYLVAIS
jgi:hypothetical protein